MKTKIMQIPRKGRGVFAVETIPAGKVIEKCQLIIMDLEEVGSVLERYVYQYKKDQAAVALGNGSLYNHSDQPNAHYYFDYRSKLLFIEASRAISAGEEITVDYGYDAEERKRFNIG